MLQEQIRNRLKMENDVSLKYLKPQQIKQLIS